MMLDNIFLSELSKVIGRVLLAKGTLPGLFRGISIPSHIASIGRFVSKILLKAVAIVS